jgi:hypothetical protein
MTNPNDRIAALEAGFTQASRRLSELETKVTSALESFGPIGPRVTELSAAFLAANERLTGLESDIEALKAAGPDALIQHLEEVVEGMETRLATVEQTRTRGGRLSTRLRDIEEKIDRLLPEGETP